MQSGKSKYCTAYVEERQSRDISRLVSWQLQILLYPLSHEPQQDGDIQRKGVGQQQDRVFICQLLQVVCVRLCCMRWRDQAAPVGAKKVSQVLLCNHLKLSFKFGSNSILKLQVWTTVVVCAHVMLMCHASQAGQDT